MRILYIDIDSLRPDHLGCYGYHRNTSPTIDLLAKTGIRFDNCFVSDAPCLPSRTAFSQGRFGINNGVVTHGGLASELRPLGSERSFSVRPGFETFFQSLAGAGYRTVSISSFPDRHGAWWFLAGLKEWHNTGRGGMETADEINTVAMPWLEQHAQEDNWFLHVNYWDAHTPYRTPESYANPFEDSPAPAWYTQAILDEHTGSFGVYGARDPMGIFYPKSHESSRSGIPFGISSLSDYKAWVDGYDLGVHFADAHLAQLLEVLDRQGVLEQTLIIVTADHGENQGELNVYGDHQTADLITCRVPYILRPPATLDLPVNYVDSGLHYQFDLSATLLELLGTKIPWGWDAKSFATHLKTSEQAGRSELILSQMAWSCQRSVRWQDWLLIRTYHAGLKNFPKLMLFNTKTDPHEISNVATAYPHVVHEGLARLEDWTFQQLKLGHTGSLDPLYTVLAEGGPFHTRGLLSNYSKRLEETDRAHLIPALTSVL